jgi:hypothetical protein
MNYTVEIYALLVEDLERDYSNDEPCVPALFTTKEKARAYALEHEFEEFRIELVEVN